MKIKESYWHEAAKADKNDKSNSPNDAAARARQTSHEQSADAANKARRSDSPAKDEPKFADFLESSAAKLQKPNKQQRQDSSDERRDDEKKEKKQRVGVAKDAADLTAANDGKSEKYESSSGGGQSGGGAGNNFGAGVGQLNLSENFAARSILHIADLERLVSTVRTQTSLGGKREIVLQLKRSVLEGLQVKITTEPGSGVKVEFLAANEQVRSQIAGHTAELADILRGRGINLQSLTAATDTNNENSSDARKDAVENVASDISTANNDLSADNTFDAPASGDEGKIYQA